MQNPKLIMGADVTNQLPSMEKDYLWLMGTRHIFQNDLRRKISDKRTRLPYQFLWDWLEGLPVQNLNGNVPNPLLLDLMQLCFDVPFSDSIYIFCEESKTHFNLFWSHFTLSFTCTNYWVLFVGGRNATNHQVRSGKYKAHRKSWDIHYLFRFRGATNIWTISSLIGSCYWLLPLVLLRRCNRW